MLSENPKIVVLIPCFNESKTIAKVINDFSIELPDAEIFVFDNCSTDGSADIAFDNKALVIKEPIQGKGFVIEKMFDVIEADIYVMVDGDDTYPADDVHKLIKPILEYDADMVVGSRLESHTKSSFRPMHLFGNRLVRNCVNLLTGAKLDDIMSGYRAFNKRVVNRIPVISTGFEIETEMTVQCLYNRIKIVEVPVSYRERPAGSESKLRTIRDGFRVLWKIFSLFISLKPLTFFGGVGVLIFILGLLAGIAPIHDYLTAPDHYVSHVPLAVLASALIILSAGSVFLGILLHAVNWRFKELHNVLTRAKKLH
jgi:glycosyltransferase involved in cell wall biosynthesis